ncbi:MAG: hypothetical protein PHX27_00555 [Candidatus ainarchaeum sp.]|nr:hypothetical protein [Candidatus ainarchaeum sp.]
MRKTCPVCNSSKYQLVGKDYVCAKCHFVSKPFFKPNFVVGEKK